MNSLNIKELCDDTAIITIIVYGTSPSYGRMLLKDVFWSIITRIADQAHTNDIVEEMAYVHIN